jgi:AcrR family transcriptional regulator
MAVLGRRTGAREQRRAALEEQILAATRELLVDGEPFGDISIEQIAAKAGISRTSFYDYYRDKRELLIALVQRAAAPILQEADELQGGRPSGPAEIPYTIKAAMRFARESREVFAAVIEASAYDTAVSAFWRGQVIDRFITVIEQRIRRQIKAGAALPIAPRAAAVALVAMVTETLYHHVTTDEKTSDNEMVKTLVTVCVRAVYGPDQEVGSLKRHKV